MAWFKSKGDSIVSTEAADVFDEAIKKIDDIYERGVGRPPEPDELIAILRFCNGESMSNVVRFGLIEPDELSAPVKGKGRPAKRKGVIKMTESTDVD
jgi:hypothetical protein